ncbi:MAG: GC-type dockerin domain-anchored protein [Planctomycetota bacterium]
MKHRAMVSGLVCSVAFVATGAVAVGSGGRDGVPAPEIEWIVTSGTPVPPLPGLPEDLHEDSEITTLWTVFGRNGRDELLFWADGSAPRGEVRGRYLMKWSRGKLFTLAGPTNFALPSGGFLGVPLRGALAADGTVLSVEGIELIEGSSIRSAVRWAEPGARTTILADGDPAPASFGRETSFGSDLWLLGDTDERGFLLTGPTLGPRGEASHVIAIDEDLTPRRVLSSFDALIGPTERTPDRFVSAPALVGEDLWLISEDGPFSSRLNTLVRFRGMPFREKRGDELIGPTTPVRSQRGPETIGLFDSVIVNTSGVAAVLAGSARQSQRSDNDMVLRVTPGRAAEDGVEVVARRNTTFSEGETSVTFGSFQLPIINDRGDLLFASAFDRTDGSGFSRSSLWLSELGQADLKRVVPGGTPLPGLDPAWVATRPFPRAPIACGGWLFSYEPQPATGPEGDYLGMGVGRLDADGSLSSLIAPGDRFVLPDGIERTVFVANAEWIDDVVLGVRLQAATSDPPDVVINVSFEDGFRAYGFLKFDLDHGRADLTGDGFVTFADLSEYVSRFAERSRAADIAGRRGCADGDGAVSVDEIVCYVRRWNAACDG